MTKNEPPKAPGQNEEGRSKKADREARAARALRENLLRRKKQLHDRKARPEQG